MVFEWKLKGGLLLELIIKKLNFEYLFFKFFILLIKSKMLSFVNL